MTELIVVLAISMLLIGLLLPVLSHVRETAHRVVCSSHLRELGRCTHQYVTDHGEQLPRSSFLDPGEKQTRELMVVYRGKLGMDLESSILWDGLGRLFAEGYCDTHEVYYCPSHHGDHPVERYEERWINHGPGLGSVPSTASAASPFIYSNYHYGGHIEWTGTPPRRRNLDDPRLIIAMDGLRSKLDFNHEVGMNVLRADTSVNWQEANVIDSLPSAETMSTMEQEEFDRIWGDLESDFSN